MAANTGTFAQLLVPGLRKVFWQYLSEQPEEYSQWINMGKSKRAYEEDLMTAGLGTMPTKSEGSPIIYQDPIQGNKKRYTHLTYGLGFRITREMYDDDLYGPMQKMSKELAKAGRNAREVAAANLLNNAFSTSYTGFNTGESLVSTSHALLGGGTYANRATTDADLGIASLEAAVISFNKIVDERNLPAMVRPSMLIIPPDLEFIAREILQSEYRPYTATNEINSMKSKGLEFIIEHYLTDSNSWYLLAKKGDHDLNFVERQAMEFQSGDDFDTGDAKYKSMQRFSTGYGDWRGVYGSAGAS